MYMLFSVMVLRRSLCLLVRIQMCWELNMTLNSRLQYGVAIIRMPGT
jgi:hypothetical protein